MSYLRRIGALTALIVLVIASGVPATLGQEEGGGSGLIISPTRSELSIAPGQKGKITVTLRNVSGTDITAKAEINDFESDGLTGEPKIITFTDRQSPTSVRNFLVGIEDIELARDEKKDFDITVEVPQNAAPGAYYGIIRYTAIPKTAPRDGQSQVSLTASLGTLVMLEVPGNILEQIQIRSLKAQLDSRASSFFSKSPDQVAIDIKNFGNGFSRPFGRITISGPTGNKEVFSYELNGKEPRSIVLPNSTRVFTDDISKVKWPGKYTISANIAHGNGGEVINYRSAFWYIPFWLIAVSLLVLAAGTTGGYMLYKKRYGKKLRKRRS